jgi:hypothetical protein
MDREALSNHSLPLSPNEKGKESISAPFTFALSPSKTYTVPLVKEGASPSPTKILAIKDKNAISPLKSRGTGGKKSLSLLGCLGSAVRLTHQAAHQTEDLATAHSLKQLKLHNFDSLKKVAQVTLTITITLTITLTLTPTLTLTLTLILTQTLTQIRLKESKRKLQVSLKKIVWKERALYLAAMAIKVR